MKFVRQFLVILLVSLLGEVLHAISLVGYEAGMFLKKKTGWGLCNPL